MTGGLRSRDWQKLQTDAAMVASSISEWLGGRPIGRTDLTAELNVGLSRPVNTDDHRGSTSIT